MDTNRYELVRCWRMFRWYCLNHVVLFHLLWKVLLRVCLKWICLMLKQYDISYHDRSWSFARRDRMWHRRNGGNHMELVQCFHHLRSWRSRSQTRRVLMQLWTLSPPRVDSSKGCLLDHQGKLAKQMHFFFMFSVQSKHMPEMAPHGPGVFFPH